MSKQAKSHNVESSARPPVGNKGFGTPEGGALENNLGVPHRPDKAHSSLLPVSTTTSAESE